MTADEIECIEEGGTEPAIALLRRRAAALDADVHPDRRTRPRIGVVRTPRSLTVRRCCTARVTCSGPRRTRDGTFN